MFNLKQHFVHLNLCIALLLGLITFVSGIEAAENHRVSVHMKVLMMHSVIFHLRLAVSLWQSYFTTSSWLHSAGCYVKEFYCLSAPSVYSTHLFLKRKSFS